MVAVSIWVSAGKMDRVMGICQTRICNDAHSSHVMGSGAREQWPSAAGAPGCSKSDTMHWNHGLEAKETGETLLKIYKRVHPLSNLQHIDMTPNSVATGGGALC